jgi:hypothetical protein
MGFFFRFVSFLALLAALVAGTVDAIRSVSESAPVLMPLGTAIASFNASGLAVVEALEQADGSYAAFQPVLRFLLQQPASAMCLIVALVFWMIGYRPGRKRATA